MPVRFSKPFIEEDDIAAVVEVLRGTHLTQGPTIEKYEKAMAAFLGAKHAVAVSSGTAALHLAVLAEGATADTWGFAPSITFSATLNCFWYCGVKNVIMIDVDPLTGQVTPATLEAALSQAPAAAHKIAIPVSLMGLPMDWPALKAVADKFGCTLIEDAAHSIGGSYTAEGKTIRSGSATHTSSAILSTHAVKQLCTGEGGMVITNSDKIAASVKLLRSHGIVRPNNPALPYWYNEQVTLGFHYRFTDIQAALGLSQLPKTDRRLAARHAIAKRYDEILGSARFASKVKLTPHHPGHAYHLYVVHLGDEKTRNAFIDFCKTRDYSLKVNYEPIHRMPYHASRLKPQELPGTMAFYAGCVSLPIYPQMTDVEFDGMIKLFAEFYSV